MSESLLDARWIGKPTLLIALLLLVGCTDAAAQLRVEGTSPQPQAQQSSTETGKMTLSPVCKEFTVVEGQIVENNINLMSLTLNAFFTVKF